MSKILTISIAGYNVEKYIRETIESLLIDDIIDELEIFVVDDGGVDRTLDIVREYQIKYPCSIYPIHKNNGGYGSTVNYSISNSNGKYFKLLDGDDWFEKDGLLNLINKLKYTDADAVISPYKRVYENRIDLIDYFELPENQIQEMLMRQKNVIAMHSLCYKTEILKKTGVILPEHTPYTDAIYAIEPFINVKSIDIVDYPVYCYRLGVEGQTVNKKNMVKNLEKLKAISNRLVKFSAQNMNNNNGEYINKYVAQNANIVARTILMSKESKSEMLQFDNEIRTINPKVYQLMESCGKTGRILKLLRKSHYSLYGLVNSVTSK